MEHAGGTENRETEAVPRAFITGVTGQDGRHLAELLHAEGYEIFGMSSREGRSALDAFSSELPYVQVRFGDLTDSGSIAAALDSVRPDEVYNLGGISSPALSFEQPVLTMNVTGVGAIRMLEAVRALGREDIRFYQASSSEMFGATGTDLDESTALRPVSPYGIAKAAAHHATVTYREVHHLFACSGILFNHEGPRRGPDFASRKITIGAARIKLGLDTELVLGNVEARRDWGYAGDYARAMWLMLQHHEPGDYVIATGETHSVREFAEAAFAAVDLDWEQFVKIDERLLRPGDLPVTSGDASKARKILGWEPTVSFEELVRLMVEADLALEAARAEGR